MAEEKTQVSAVDESGTATAGTPASDDSRDVAAATARRDARPAGASVPAALACPMEPMEIRAEDVKA